MDHFQCSLSVEEWASRINIDKTLSILRCNAEVFEQGEHVLADRFVMFVNQAPVFWFAGSFPPTDTSESVGISREGVGDFRPSRRGPRFRFVSCGTSDSQHLGTECRECQL